MADKIYIRNEAGELHPAEEKEFETEDSLQQLIARHPELLAGDRMRPDDPLRWILVQREMPIEGWAVDLLLMDQHSYPTLVEVKRGDNREGRRAVVGQMLDYASAAAAAWSGDTMRVAFEQDAEYRGSDPDEELRALLGLAHDADMEKEANAFWELAAANLEAGQMRLLFVSDKIPVELERSVTFWNAQTNPHMEVLAVEIKQYPGKFGDALVSRVIGQVDAPHKTRGGSRRLGRGEIAERFHRSDVRSAIESFLTAAEQTGTNVELRPASASLAVIVRCRSYPQGVPIARLWAPTQNHVDGLFVFYQIRDGGYPDKVQAALDQWVGKFKDDNFTADAPDRRDLGVSIGADHFVHHLNLIIERLLGTVADLTKV